MSSDNSSHSQIEEVHANGNASNNYDLYGAVTYEDLVRNPDLFWAKHKEFLDDIQRYSKIPIMGGKTVDLHRLFAEVTFRGGLERVNQDRKCKEVIDELNIDAKVTNSAFVLRKVYQKQLFEFEHVYYFQEPLSTFPIREEAFKQLVPKSETGDKGTTHELQPGVVVEGIIDGKFKDGYFVTVKVGSEELKGVLFQSSQKSKKRSSKSSEVHPKQPKIQRSGYNFFVSEQYSRLKPEYVGQDQRLIMKEIGMLWSNLSVSDKKVYQEKGFEDAQRYVKELEEYRSFMVICEAETVAATDASASASAGETVAAAIASTSGTAGETVAATEASTSGTAEETVAEAVPE